MEQKHDIICRDNAPLCVVFNNEKHRKIGTLVPTTIISVIYTRQKGI